MKSFDADKLFSEVSERLKGYQYAIMVQFNNKFLALNRDVTHNCVLIDSFFGCVYFCSLVVVAVTLDDTKGDENIPGISMSFIFLEFKTREAKLST